MLNSTYLTSLLSRDPTPSYIPLSNSDDEHKHSSRLHPDSSLSFPLLLTCTLVAITSIVNISLIPYALTAQDTHTSTISFRDPYLGLARAADALAAQSPVWDHSWPESIARMSQRLKNAVYGEGIQVYLTVEVP